MKRLLASVLALVAVFASAGCGSGDPMAGQRENGGPIVVGSADFAESQLLMEIYAEALRETGAEVETKGRIGAREVYVNAVRDGEIAVIPEYSGNLLRHFDQKATATESEQVYGELKSVLPDELRVLRQSSAEDSDVLTVTKQTADSGLKSMADLGPRCGDLVLGAPVEWESRWKNKIAEMYGCTFREIRGLEAGSVTVNALVNDKVQVANLFSTSAQIRSNDLVKLDDPKNMFPAQNVLPLVHREALNKRQVGALNAVSTALTTDKLIAFNERMVVDKANPRDVAKEFVAKLDI